MQYALHRPCVGTYGDYFISEETSLFFIKLWSYSKGKDMNIQTYLARLKPAAMIISIYVCIKLGYFL